jgi:YVTN family beta-propeller protein
MRRIPPLLGILVLAVGLALLPRHLGSRPSIAPDFTHFESGHVHPLALTPSGERLLVVNTADNRLAVFSLTGPAPAKVADIPVGLEPVAVAALGDSEAWVVNHLSDDVSVVNLNTLHVRATLRVGDEPCDVVFAGAGPLAYVSVSQEDRVRAFDVTTLQPVASIAIQARLPRALARNADGSRVYVAGFQAGNRTSVLSEAEARDSLPPSDPPMDPALPPAPKVALVIGQQANGNWVDESGRLWNAKAKYTVLDHDVSEIHTGTQQVVRTFGGIGTVNFGLAVNPADGMVALTGTEARNLTRFEPKLSGHLVDTRAGLISTAGAVTLRDLNPHVVYGVTPGPQAEHDSALGIPTGVAWAAGGQRFYVTSLASDRLGVFDPAAPAPLARVATVAGPTGVLVDGARGRIYVLGRFRNQLQTLSASTLASLAVASIGFEPTPAEIVNGRKFFYGGFTSGHGEQACATCHVFGDFDNIAWDLGNPLGTMQPINTAGQTDPLIRSSVHPMKGPMTTQSLRGLPGTGMLHWRADRQNLDAFNPAFVGLMGRAVQLPDSEMAAFDAFVLPLAYPPNPNRFLDRSLRTAPLHQPSAERGRDFFVTQPTDAGAVSCNGCHTSDNWGPGTNGQIINGFALQATQDMKVPQLRNLYQKTGFTDLAGALNKRGFGFTHNGAVDNLFQFLKFTGFDFNEPFDQSPDENRRDVEAFLLAFDTGMAPAVGAQVTFRGPDNDDAGLVARLDTLQQRQAAGECDLIAKGRVNGVARGWIYQGGQQWKPDLQAAPTIASATLRALGGPGSEVTVTGVPPGAGQRIGIDRDRDTWLDGDELAAGSDPGNPVSTPANVAVSPPANVPGLRAVRPNPFRSSIEIEFALARAGAVDCVIYDLLGREVASLARGRAFPAGVQRLAWDGRDRRGASVAAGMYFVRLRTTEGSWTRAVARLR